MRGALLLGCGLAAAAITGDARAAEPPLVEGIRRHELRLTGSLWTYETGDAYAPTGEVGVYGAPWMFETSAKEPVSVSPFGLYAGMVFGRYGADNRRDHAPQFGYRPHVRFPLVDGVLDGNAWGRAHLTLQRDQVEDVVATGALGVGAGVEVFGGWVALDLALDVLQPLGGDPFVLQGETEDAVNRLSLALSTDLLALFARSGARPAPAPRVVADASRTLYAVARERAAALPAAERQALCTAARAELSPRRPGRGPATPGCEGRCGVGAALPSQPACGHAHCPDPVWDPRELATTEMLAALAGSGSASTALVAELRALDAKLVNCARTTRSAVERTGQGARVVYGTTPIEVAAALCGELPEAAAADPRVGDMCAVLPVITPRPPPVPAPPRPAPTGDVKPAIVCEATP